MSTIRSTIITLALGLALFGACANGMESTTDAATTTTTPDTTVAPIPEAQNTNVVADDQHVECFKPELEMSERDFTDALGEPIERMVEDASDSSDGSTAVGVVYPQGGVSFVNDQAISWYLEGEEICR